MEEKKIKKDYLAGATYKEICEKHSIKPNQLKYLIKKNKWKRKSNRSKVQKGNKNAKGNKGGHAPEGNKNAVQIAQNAVNEAKATGKDVVIVDTAGRLAIDEL